MPHLIVCRLDQIAETAALNGVREMVSLVPENHAFHRPAVIDPNRHLRLGMNDITAPESGLVAPERAHVERIVAFARSWDRRAPLLIHCWLGISRSPAAALIAALACAPDQDDAQLAGLMRRISPFVTPNRLLVELGDDILGRGGRLVDAVNAIGRGADAYHGDSFALPLRGEAGTIPLTGPGGHD